MGAFRGKFGSPRNRLQDGGILRIPRTSRISRKNWRLWGGGIRKFFIGGDFGFPGTGYLMCEIFFCVSAELAAWRNPPNPTLVVGADSVYPDHLRLMYRIYIDGYLPRGIRNSPKTAWRMSRFSRISRISRTPRISRKMAFGRIRIFPIGEILVFGYVLL